MHRRLGSHGRSLETARILQHWRDLYPPLFAFPSTSIRWVSPLSRFVGLPARSHQVPRHITRAHFCQNKSSGEDLKGITACTWPPHLGPQRLHRSVPWTPWVPTWLLPVCHIHVAHTAFTKAASAHGDFFKTGRGSFSA